MMEPVAWTQDDAESENVAFAEWFKESRHSEYPDIYTLTVENAMHSAWQEAAKRATLVRLSDAEARIAELQAKIEWLELEAEGQDNGKRDLAEVLNCADEPRWKHMRREAVQLKARANAAEALLKEAGKALEPFAKLGSVISVTQQYRMFLQVMVCPFGDNHPNDYRPHLEAVRAIHDKIGVKDE